MRIVSWNVNGLRAVLKNTGKSLKQFLDDFEAEIICLQETKATSKELGHCIVLGAHFFSTQRNSWIALIAVLMDTHHSSHSVKSREAIQVC